jgi:hypothetical protein
VGLVPTLRVNDERFDEFSSERRRFASAILPVWSRKSRRRRHEHSGSA